MKHNHRAALYAGTALAMVAQHAAAQPAPNARPTGGQIAQGQATIGGNATTTLITQKSQSAVINWTGFNIGSAQTVQFAQPTTNSIALNRVIAAQPSQIAGHILANGQIAIVNQSGVVFFHGATVNTAGLVVSAAGITDQDFMAGRMVFSQAPHPGAAISNAGNITIGQAGLAALVAPQVANAGVITAQLGRVILGGATTFALDMNGDGLVALNVTGQVTQVQVGGAKIDALVTNIGTILAPGGTVVLTAAAADGLVQKIISVSGTIAAPTAGAQTGRVLVSGIGGDVEIDGAISATGAATGTVGGQVEVNSDRNVTIEPSAVVDASGDSGGGVVAIGTTATYAATAPIGQASRTAASTTIAAGASIAANATRLGSGGRIAVAAANSTNVSGTVAASGGPAGGSGGSIVVAGRAIHEAAAPDPRAGGGSAAPTTTAEMGNTEIVDLGSLTCPIATNCVPYTTFFSEASNGKFDVVDGGLTFSSGASSSSMDSINFETTAAGSLAVSGNITLQSGVNLSAANITASAAGSIVLLGTLTAAAGDTVSLTAGGGITEDAPPPPGGPPQTPGIDADKIILVAKNGDVQLDQPTNQITTLLSASATGSLNLANGKALIISGAVNAGSVTLTTVGALTIGGVITAGALTGTLYGGSTTLEAVGGDITETAGGALHAGDLVANASTPSGGTDLFSVRLDAVNGTAPANQIGTLASGRALQNAASGDFVVTDAQTLTIAGVVTAGATGGIATLMLAAPSLEGPNGVLHSLGGTIALEADRFNLGGAIDAGSGEAAFDVFSKTSLIVLNNGGNFGSIGLANVTAGTLVLGSIDGAIGNTSSLEIDEGLPGKAGITTLGLFSSGDITESTITGSIGVSRLYGAAGGSIVLDSATNDIGTIVAGGKVSGLGALNAIDLVDGSLLTITGTVSAQNITLRANAGLVVNDGGLVNATGGALGNGTLLVTTQTGGIVLLGTLQAGALAGGVYGGNIDLFDAGGGMTESVSATETATGAIHAGSLAGTAAAAFDLTGADNQIAAIAPAVLPNGSTTLTGLAAAGTVSLTDAQTLAVQNTTLVTGGTTLVLAPAIGGTDVTIDLSAGFFNQLAGTMSADSSGGTVSLASANMIDAHGSGPGIHIFGTIRAGTKTAAGAYDGNVVLDAQGGNIIEYLEFGTATLNGAILAGTLQATASSSAAGAGSIILGSADASPINHIATLDSITRAGSNSATGDFIVTDADNLTVAADVTAGTAGDTELFLGTSGGTLTLAKGATLASGSLTTLGGTIALEADNFVLKGALDAGSGEVAADRYTPGTLMFGVELGALNIVADTLVLGSVTGSVGHTNNLIIDQTLPQGVTTLGLFSQGNISDSHALTVTSLFGAAAGNITLDNNSNMIGTIGAADGLGKVTGLSSGGTLALTDAPANGTLVVAPNATLVANGDVTVTLAGAGGSQTTIEQAGTSTIASVTGNVTLVTGLLTQDSHDTVSATLGNVTVNGSASQTNGSISAGANVLIGGSLDQTISGVTAGQNVIVTGNEVSQANISSIDAGNGVYLLLGLGFTPGNFQPKAGFTQDATSIVVSHTAPLVIDTKTGGIDFAGTLQAGTIALNAEGGSIQGTLSNGTYSTSGTVLAGTLAAHAAGSVLLENAGNQVGAVDQRDITALRGSYTQHFDGLVADGSIPDTGMVDLRDGSNALSLGIISQGTVIGATVSGTAVTINLLDATTGVAIGTLTQTGGNMIATAGGGTIALEAIQFDQSAAGTVIAAGNVAITGNLMQTGSLIRAGNIITVTGGAVTQRTASTIAGENGVYMLIDGGISQDATSAITAGADTLAASTNPLLVIDTKGGDIDLAGLVQAGTLAAGATGADPFYTGTLALVAEHGSIDGGGTMLGGTLGGSATGSLLLNGGGNIVAEITPLTITDTDQLYIKNLSGLSAGAALALNDTTSLLVAGTSTAPVLLQGASVALDLRHSDGTAGTLTERLGTISAIATDVALGGELVQSQATLAAIGNVEIGFDTTTNAALGGAISQNAGIISAGGSVTVLGPDATLGQTLASSITGTNGVYLTLAGGLAQDSTSLIAAGGAGSKNPVLAIQAAGTIDFAGALQAGTMALYSSQGSILGSSGMIRAGTLAARATGDLLLNGGANQIVAIGPASILLPRQTVPLTLSGLAAAGTLLLNDTISLAIGNTTAGALVQGENVTITLLNSAGQPTGTLTQTNGTIAASQGDLTMLALGFTQAGGTADAMGTVTIKDAFVRQTSGTIDGIGGVALLEGSGLAQDAASLILGGGAVGGFGGGTAEAQLQTGTPAIVIDERTGDIAFAGTIQAGPFQAGAYAGAAELLASAGSVTGTGNLLAGTLSGAASGSLSLTGTANNFGTIAPAIFSDQARPTPAPLAGLVAGGALTVADTASLTILGATLQGTAVTLALGTAGLTQLAGAITATAGNLVLTAGNITQQGGLDTATGQAALTTAGNLFQTDAGTIAAAGPVTLSLGGDYISDPGSTIASTGGNIDFTAHAFTVGGILNAANGFITLADAGAGGFTEDTSGDIIGALGVTFMLQGDFIQPANTARVISTAGNVVIHAGNITQGGAIGAAGQVLIGGTGSLVQLGGALIDGGTGVTISLLGSVTQGAGATILSGADTNAGSIGIDAPAMISLAGTLAAGTIRLGGITAPQQMIWNNNVIETGSSLPAGRTGVRGRDVLTLKDVGARGVFAYTDRFSELGVTTIKPLADSQATVEITLAGTGGLVQFTPGLGNGLFAPNGQLILDLKQTGRATGNIVVAGLNLFYDGLAPPPNGFAMLTGEVAGLTGFAAAGAGFTHSVPGAHYTINSCPIQSINCVLLSPIIVPVNNPVAVEGTTVLHRRDEDDDLILPNVAEQDY